MAGSNWGVRNPTEFIDEKQKYFLAFDDHRYLKWDSLEKTQAAHIKTSCADNRTADGLTIVGEWSLAVADQIQDTPGWNPSTQKDFYKKWFAAQVDSYEKRTKGWVYWTWKTQLGDDYRWSYKGKFLSR